MNPSCDINKEKGAEKKLRTFFVSAVIRFSCSILSRDFFLSVTTKMINRIIKEETVIKI